MRVAFRVDASRRIGTGHAMRCLTLADTLRSRGAACVFLHRDQPGHVGDLICDRGFEVRFLPARESSEAGVAATESPDTWLGVSVEKDIEDTQNAISEAEINWLFVDHYSLGASWEAHLRVKVGQIAVIDDLADREHDCDLLIDQSAVPNPTSRYDGLVPEHALRLCGPEYAIIAEPYSRARALVGPRRGPLSRVLVYYGGSDPDNETLRALRVLSNAAFAQLAADVVVGPNHPDPQSIREIAAIRPNTVVHESQPDLVPLMLEADCFLGAGGTTTWERCSVGLPSIVTTIADNQIPFTQYLHDQRALIYAGDRKTVSDGDLYESLTSFLHDPTSLCEVAKRAWKITDAFGRLRVAEVIQPTATEQLTLSRMANSHCILTGPNGLAFARVFFASTGEVTDLEFTIEPALPRACSQKSVLEAVARCAARMTIRRTRLQQKDADPLNTKERFLHLSQRCQHPTARRDGDLRYITILSDRDSWVNAYIPGMVAQWLLDGLSVRWIHGRSDIQPGDVCFLLGCGQLVTADLLEKNTHNLVVHESNLPEGRGWSPLTWQIIEGRSTIPVCLLEAHESVDSGPIYLRKQISFKGYELIDEMRHHQAKVSFSMCDEFLRKFPDIVVQREPQEGTPTYYPRRKPEDSEINPRANLEDQFEDLRVVDNQRYPAFFYHRGRRYILRIWRDDEK